MTADMSASLSCMDIDSGLQLLNRRGDKPPAPLLFCPTFCFNCSLTTNEGRRYESNNTGTLEQTHQYHRCEKRFLRFLFFPRFLRVLFLQTFFYYKNVGKRFLKPATTS
jgi:hypothetical protein